MEFHVSCHVLHCVVHIIRVHVHVSDSVIVGFGWLILFIETILNFQVGVLCPLTLSRV